MGNEQTTDWGAQYSLLHAITHSHSRVALIAQPQAEYSRLSLFLEPEEKSIMIARLRKRKEQSSSYLQQVVKIFQKEGGICGNLQQVDVIWSLSSPSLLDHCRFRRLKRMPFREEEVLEVIRSVGNAVEYLHNIGEAHGSINLASIIVQGSIYLKDPIFASKEQDEDSHPRRAAPAFPSPQKLREHYDVVLNLGDFYSDLFSLGVLALQMCYLERDIRREIYRPKQAAYLNWSIDFARTQQLLGGLPSLSLRQSIQVLLSPEEIPRGMIFSLNSQVQINPKALKLLSQNPFSIAPEEELFSEIEPYCQANASRVISSLGGVKNLNGSNITQAEHVMKNRGKRINKYNTVVIDNSPVGGLNEGAPSKYSVPIFYLPQPLKFTSTPQEFFSHPVEVYSSLNRNLSFIEARPQQRQQMETGSKYLLSQLGDHPKETYNFSALGDTIRRLSSNLLNLIQTTEMEKAQRQSTQSALFAAESLPLQKPDSILKWKTVGMIEEDSLEHSSCSEAQFVVEEYQIGTRYEGFKRDGKRNGKGKFYYSEGSVYVGEWRDNKMHGFGALTYSNGCTAYEGEWEDDEFHGRGTLYNEDPAFLAGLFDYTDFNCSEGLWLTYQGDLRRGRRQGFGKLTLVNGECLEGEFRRDKVDGHGIFYCLTGQKVQGVWRQNFFTPPDNNITSP